MKFIQILQSALKPQGNYREEERKLIIRKNGIVLGINTMYLLWMIMRWLILRISSTNDFLCMFIPLLVEYIVTLVFCRSHPKTYHYIYWLRVLVYGPFSRYLLKASFLTNFTATLILPLQALYIGENVRNFLAICLCNIIGTFVFYEGNLEVMVTNLSPRDFTNAFMIIFVIVQLVSMIILYGIHTSFEIYKEKIVTEESNIILADKQRNFLLSFSHELRNLMNSIIGNIQICVLDDFPSHLKEYLTDAKISSEVLLNLINNILDSGKAEIGELEIDSREFNLHKKLKELWRYNLTLIERKGLKGRFLISKQLPKSLEFDYYRLAQVINNLIANSIKFTDRGTIELLAIWYPNKSAVSSDCFSLNPYDDEGKYIKFKNLSQISGEYYSVSNQDFKPDHHNFNYEQGILRIDVVDSGCGINQEDFQKIFQRYVQDSNGKTRDKISLGIGLYVSREILRKMRGEIKVFSRKEEGSAFVLCIPAKVIKPKEFSRRYKCMFYTDINSEMPIMKTKLENAGLDVLGMTFLEEELFLCLKNLIEIRKFPEVVVAYVSNELRQKSLMRKIREFENEERWLLKKMIIVGTNEIIEEDWNKNRLARIETLSNIQEFKRIVI